MGESWGITKYMFDRRLVQYFDWGLLCVTLIISFIGLMTLYSAVSAGISTPQKVLYVRQLIWYGLGLIAMIISFLFHYKALERWASVFYLFCILLLIAVLLFGRYIGGSRRWLTIASISIQPSELVKIATIIVLARYYSNLAKTTGLKLKELLMPSVLVVIPFILIVKQPDLGTAVLVLLIAASITCFVKIEKRTLIYIIAFCGIIIPSVWFFLKEYQKQRILTFLNPERDPLGTGYHIIQSKIAIGSGMLYGKGFLQGTQNAFSFLPEEHTDFIFSVLAEEWGFTGSLVLLFAFLMLIVCGLNIAYGCRDSFGTILAVGITAMLAWEIFINIGMVAGIVPVVGVPLPFISYGGSSILTVMISIGILMNISMRRFMHQ